MKKPVISILTIILFSNTISFSQDIRLGGGLGYGSRINNIGLNFRGDIKIRKHWSITPHFNYFFDKSKGAVTFKWNALNIDGHYYIDMDNTWNIYPLFGFNFASVAEKENEITFSSSDIGLNIGLGSEYYFDRRLSGFGEAKYVLGNADQLVLAVGFLYKL